MKCLEMQDKFIDFVDNELKGEELESFLEHINTCSECKENLEMYYSLLNGCKGINKEVELPENFHSDLMKKVRTEAHQTKKKKMYWLRYAGSIAAIFVCVMCLFLFNEKTQNDSKYDVDLAGATASQDEFSGQKSYNPEGNVEAHSNRANNIEEDVTSVVDPYVSHKEPTSSEDLIEDSSVAPSSGDIESKPGEDDAIQTQTNDVNTKEDNTNDNTKEDNTNDNEKSNNYGMYVGVSLMIVSFSLIIIFLYKHFKG